MTVYSRAAVPDPRQAVSLSHIPVTENGRVCVIYI